MSTFRSQIIIDAQTNLVKVGKTINRSLKRTKLSVEKLSKSFRRLSKRTTAAGRSMVTAGKRAALGLTLPIAAATVGIIKAASDAEEVGAKFNTVFEAVQRDANNVADNIAKNFGLAGSSARELLSSSGDLLTGFGFTDKAALDLSKRIAKLSVDVASFSNVEGGAARVAGALNSALTGEREALKSLGIVINEDLIKRELQQRGLQDLTGETLRAAKAVITLDLSFKQSGKAIGDFARTQEGAANQFRIIQQRTKNLAEEFGAVLLPIVVKITKRIIPLIDRFAALSTENKELILIVAGIAAVLGPVVGVMGLLTIGIGALVPAVTALAGAFSFLFLTPPGLIILGIVAAVIALTVVIKKNFKVVKPFLIDVWKRVSTAAVPIIERIKETLGELAFIISKVMRPILASLKPLFISVFGGNTSEVLATLGKIIEFSVITPLKVFLFLLESIVGVASTVVNSVESIAMAISSISFDPINKGLDLIKSAQDAFGDITGAGSFLGGIGDSLGLTDTPSPTAPLPAQSMIQKLQVAMTIDSEGRPRVKSAESNADLSFKADLGMTTPIGASI